MNAPCGALQLFLAAALHFQYGVTTILPRQTETEPTVEVIKFLDVFSRSVCQVKETIVSLDDEYPELVAEHIIVPSCVFLKRCAGCCTDESTTCMALKTHTVAMEVMLLSPFQHSQVIQLTFEEHTKCACRPRKSFSSATPSPTCAPCLDRKKQLDPRTCECVCRHDSTRCEERGWELNKATCRCVKLQRRPNRKAKKVL
ncbi:vascular endothelial growth factor B isoform X2 [Rhineura floridana]|uniref:vascular endothelial growth factor B isoform X2 n=1 Tax=Rhineura floridana TaxID=261503 RepID=UPI002AC8606E|nr:vascular endothelial growth factor B isoform X2 [Rhineura floridana]